MDHKRVRRLFIPLVTFLCASVFGSGGDTFAQTEKAKLPAEIHSILEDISERQRLVGLQAAVSLGGKLIFSESSLISLKRVLIIKRCRTVLASKLARAYKIAVDHHDRIVAEGNQK